MTDWAAVIAGDFALPERRPLRDLLDELSVLLASPVPEERDDIAYTILAVWAARGVLDDHLAVLGDRMAKRLGDDQIHVRTFAALVLAWVVLREARTAELDVDTVSRWRDDFAGWWLHEQDLRGWDARLGWLHAVAHGADTLRAFGRSPRLGAADLCGLLDLAVDRLFADAGYLYAQSEDDRIAYALATVLTRDELSAEQAIAWLERVRAALEAGEPGPVPAWASNTFRTLSSLYTFVDRGVRWFDPDIGELGNAVAVPRAEVIKDRIAALLQLAWRGLA